jgi:DinB superfamily
MTDNGLPCLDLLEATPSILRGLMSELTDDDARWKPAPDRFSVAEVLAHLSHSEGHCYRMRLDRFLAESRPTFEPDDAQMYLDLYRDADPEDAFDHFEEQRETNIEYLRELPSEAGGRVALHREAARNARTSLPQIETPSSRSNRVCPGAIKGFADGCLGVNAG